MPSALYFIEYGMCFSFYFHISAELNGFYDNETPV